MPRYTAESRERVRDAVDFAELVGARTELKRAGVRRLQGLCPFHEERTPSFGIDPVEKLYHCFGCGKGGDLFAFVIETEGLDFTAALESLAERYRVPLEREAEDPRDAARRERRERLLALLERTAAWYVRLLWDSPEAAAARDYLAARGLSEEALRAFRVGWAPDAWERVVTASRRAGYGEDELLAVGLASPGQRGPIDRFRARIMFPLADERGRVLGFGARALRPGDRPKYLNTSESELFHKGRLVYGADLARAAAARAGRVVLVEGYTDVIALHHAGVPEAVGSMGTALTDAQVDALARLAPRALFCQDPDAAGQESVARAIAGLRRHNRSRDGRGVEFRIVRLPRGLDPADVVQREGSDAMRGRLEAAVPIERFEVERALEQGDTSTSDGRDAILAAAARTLAPMPASVLREELVRLVAERLGLGEQLVNEALTRPPRARDGVGPPAPWHGGGPFGRDGPWGGAHGRGAGGPWGAAQGPGSGPWGGADGRRDGGPWGGAEGRRDGGPWGGAEGRRDGGPWGAAPGAGGGGSWGGDEGRRGGGAWGRSEGRRDGGPWGGSEGRRDGGPWDGAGGRRDGGAWGDYRRGWRGRRGDGRFRAPPDPVDPRAALARREQSERAFLALCLALPDEGERLLTEADFEDYFSAPATREAAAYLRGRLRAPAADLPPGDEALARVVAELVIRAGQLDATPAKLELEKLQLDLHRLERHIASARLSGGEGVGALAAERQRVLDAIRHRLT